MDDGRVIRMQKEHSSCDLASDVDASVPRHFLIRFMEQIEKCGLDNIKYTPLQYSFIM